MADANLPTIIDFLLGKGLSSAQAAGVAGNLKIESGYSPTAYNAHEGAIGIAQWRLGRRTALQAFAAKRGTTERDLMTQLEFLWHELTGSELAAGNALRATTTVADAAAVFDAKFERSSGQHRTQRQSAATLIYQQIVGGSLGAGSGGFGGGGAFDVQEPWLPLPVTPGSPAGSTILTVKDFLENPFEWLTSLVWKPLQGMAITGVFIAGGAVIVAIGLAQAVKPAAARAARGAQTVIQTVRP